MQGSSVVDYRWDASYRYRFKLVIAGQNVTKSVTEGGIQGLEQLLDFPTPSQFDASDVQILLSDPTGYFNPYNPDNFFTKHWDRKGVAEHYNQTGFGVPVTIELGYLPGERLKTVFVGRVIDIDYELQPPTTLLTVSDDSQIMRKGELDDFGIERAFQLAQNKDVPDFRGVYDFPYGPISDESVSEAYVILDKRVDLEYVKNIRYEGKRDPTKFAVGGGFLEVEGGAFENDALPNVRYKDFYRYRRVDAVVNAVR